MYRQSEATPFVIIVSWHHLIHPAWYGIWNLSQKHGSVKKTQSHVPVASSLLKVSYSSLGGIHWIQVMLKESLNPWPVCHCIIVPFDKFFYYYFHYSEQYIISYLFILLFTLDISDTREEKVVHGWTPLLLAARHGHSKVAKAQSGSWGGG